MKPLPAVASRKGREGRNAEGAGFNALGTHPTATVSVRIKAFSFAPFAPFA